MMNDQDKLGAMFAVMEEQQAAVQSAIAGLAQERKAMAAAIDAIKGTAGTLQKATGDAAAQAVGESIGQAPKAATAALNQAVGALNDAAGKVGKAGAWLTFKAAASIAGAGLVMVLAVAAFGWYMMPTEAQRQEIRDLRAEKAQLQANIDELNRRGGKIKLTTCSDSNGKDRLCIAVARNQGPGFEKYIAPFSNGSGEQFVVPKGY